MEQLLLEINNLKNNIIEISRVIYQNNTLFSQVPIASFLEKLTVTIDIFANTKFYIEYQEVMENLLVDIMNAFESLDEVLFADLIRHDLIYVLDLIYQRIEDENVL